MSKLGVFIVILFALSGHADGRGGDDGCAGQPDGYYCDDGNACTRIDRCQHGACVGTNAVVCTAPNPCYAAGVCDPDTGLCSHPPLTDRRSASNPLCVRGGFE